MADKKHQDSLLSSKVGSSKFKVPRNLILVVGGVLIALIVAVMAIQIALTPEKAAPVAQDKPTIDLSKTPSKTAFNDMVVDQEKSGERIAKTVKEPVKDADTGAVTPSGQQTSQPRPPIPSPLPHTENGRLVLPSVGAGNPQSDDMAHELLIKNSPISAIPDTTGQSSQQSQQTQEQTISRSESSSVSNDSRSSYPSLGGLNGMPISKTRAEKEWVKENAKLEPSKETLRGYAPSSRFVIQQGSVINAVLMTAVNTDLPGEVQARVLMDIYDSIDQKYLLIPKGSKLIGVYNSEVRIGQDRVNMAFKRLILPNGISVDLPGNMGMDPTGMSGVPGKVNNHYGQMFLISTLTAIGAYAAEKNKPQPNAQGNNLPPGQSAAGQILINMNNGVIERNKALEPTITIPQGVRFLINVAKDIELPPYAKY